MKAKQDDDFDDFLWWLQGEGPSDTFFLFVFEDPPPSACVKMLRMPMLTLLPVQDRVLLPSEIKLRGTKM